MQSSPSSPGAASAPPTFLVVDDNRHMRRLLVEMLHGTWENSSILQAADAEEAFAQCRQGAPQVVVMDVRLPDQDGISATSIIRQLYPEMAVVICSGHDGSAYRVAAHSAGAVAYVAKSEVSSALVPAIAAALLGHASGTTCGDDS
jgi:DNA-binding NarL/FixJ family response regulator